MIIDSGYQKSIPDNDRNKVVIERNSLSNQTGRTTNEGGLVASESPNRLIISSANIIRSPSASDSNQIEAYIEDDLRIAQKSHLEYLSGQGRQFDDFLAELRHDEDTGVLSD